MNADTAPVLDSQVDPKLMPRMCPGLARARLALYEASKKMVTVGEPTGKQFTEIETERRSQEYRKALGYYKAHLRECPECREWFKRKTMKQDNRDFESYVLLILLIALTLVALLSIAGVIAGSGKAMLDYPDGNFIAPLNRGETLEYFYEDGDGESTLSVYQGRLIHTSAGRLRIYTRVLGGSWVFAMETTGGREETVDIPEIGYAYNMYTVISWYPWTNKVVAVRVMLPVILSR